jgi:hypothetical protein
MTPEKFPLAWPPGYPVTDQRTESKFICTMAEAKDGIYTELERLRATDVLISTNVQVDKRGIIPASGRLVYANPGVAVYFKFKGEDKVVACDKWYYLHENLRAVQKSIEAIRGLERWGCSDIISRAMGDMKALPEKGSASANTWWDELGVNQFAPAAAIKAAYRVKSKNAHPDGGGSAAAFDRLTKAYTEGLNQVK